MDGATQSPATPAQLILARNRRRTANGRYIQLEASTTLQASRRHTTSNSTGGVRKEDGRAGRKTRDGRSEGSGGTPGSGGRGGRANTSRRSRTRTRGRSGLRQAAGTPPFRVGH